MSDLPYPENFANIITELICTTFEISRKEFFARMRIFNKQKSK